MDFNLEKYHLKSVSLFDFLSEEESGRVKNKLLRKEYGKGELLFKEHTYSKGLYMIRRGKVKIFQSNKEGKESIVYIYKKGDFFGYRPLLAHEPHPVSAVAMDHVVISFVSRDLFLSVLDQSPTLAGKLLVSLTREFSVWINKLTVFAQYGVKERVALSLLILNKVYQVNDESLKSTTISISRDDFAGFVGTAKETLVRMLRTFKDENIITTRGAKLVILKPKALYAMLSDL